MAMIPDQFALIHCRRAGTAALSGKILSARNGHLNVGRV